MYRPPPFLWRCSLVDPTTLLPLGGLAAQLGFIGTSTGTVQDLVSLQEFRRMRGEAKVGRVA